MHITEFVVAGQCCIHSPLNTQQRTVKKEPKKTKTKTNRFNTHEYLSKWTLKFSIVQESSNKLLVVWCGNVYGKKILWVWWCANVCQRLAFKRSGIRGELWTLMMFFAQLRLTWCGEIFQWRQWSASGLFWSVYQSLQCFSVWSKQAHIPHHDAVCEEVFNGHHFKATFRFTLKTLWVHLILSISLVSFTLM